MKSKIIRFSSNTRGEMNSVIKNSSLQKNPDDLLKQIFIVYRRIRPRSINTKKNQHSVIRDIADILRRYFNLIKLRNLQEKHIRKIIEEWKKRGYKPGTLTTKIGFLRKLCISIGKESCIKDNKYYGIRRGRVVFTDKRWTPGGTHDFEIIIKVDGLLHKYGKRIRDCLIPERIFGLRKREALRFHPCIEIICDEKNNPIRIELTLGTKNNRHRTIPVFTQEQQIFLREIHNRYEFDPLQPYPQKDYKKWERTYYYILDKIGINHQSTGHGLRQAYANDRLKAILEETRKYCELNNFYESDKKIRLVAYQKLTKELGHGRIDILKSYLADYSTPSI